MFAGVHLRPRHAHGGAQEGVQGKEDEDSEDELHILLLPGPGPVPRPARHVGPGQRAAGGCPPTPGGAAPWPGGAGVAPLQGGHHHPPPGPHTPPGTYNISRYGYTLPICLVVVVSGQCMLKY